MTEEAKEETKEFNMADFAKQSDERFAAQNEMFANQMKQQGEMFTQGLALIAEKLAPKQQEKNTYGLTAEQYEKSDKVIDLMRRVVEDSTKDLNRAPSKDELAKMIDSSLQKFATQMSSEDPVLNKFLEQVNPLTGRPLKQEFSDAQERGDSATVAHIREQARKATNNDDSLSGVQSRGADPQMVSAQKQMQDLKSEYENLQARMDAGQIKEEEFESKQAEIHAKAHKLDNTNQRE